MGCSHGSDAENPGRSQWLKEAAGFCAAWLLIAARTLQTGRKVPEGGSLGPGSLLDRMLQSSSYEAQAEALRIIRQRVNGHTQRDFPRVMTCVVQQPSRFVETTRHHTRIWCVL